MLDTTEVGLSFSEASSALLVRLLMNVGVAVIAALAGSAARVRERYFEKQQQLDRLQADLVAAFSHDLRAPLATIAGYAELLRGDFGAPSSFEATAALYTILAEVYRLDELIADMLGAAHNNGKAPLQVSEFEAAALVTELRSELDHARRSAQVNLLWHVESTLPALQTDRAKVVSVVRDLVNNALKFTGRGTVLVRIAYDKDPDAHRMEVEDTGPGIPPEALPHLFDRFYRAAETREIDGFGLGLFIAWRFTELLHGSIKVESELGRGTRFVVTIPRLLAQPPPPMLPGQPRSCPRRCWRRSAPLRRAGSCRGRWRAGRARAPQHPASTPACPRSPRPWAWS